MKMNIQTKISVFITRITLLRTQQVIREEQIV